MVTLRESRIRRVVLVVLDGLRPDAIPRYALPHLTALARGGASTMFARTVSPSVTACAMASLMTGAAPSRHGLESDRFHLPRPRGVLHPLPRVLARHSLPSSYFMASVPFLFTGIAHRIAAHLGFSTTRLAGAGCDEILLGARRALREQKRGLIAMHWPDGDRAGHASGWMSRGYEDAVRRMDGAMGALVREIGTDDPATLLIAMSDHGGGGARVDHHDSEHPLDRTIPIILAGGSVRAGEIAAGASLLDVPPTICRALGVPLPDSYAGFPLSGSLPAQLVAA